MNDKTLGGPLVLRDASKRRGDWGPDDYDVQRPLSPTADKPTPIPFAAMCQEETFVTKVETRAA